MSVPTLNWNRWRPILTEQEALKRAKEILAQVKANRAELLSRARERKSNPDQTKPDPSKPDQSRPS
jgi:chromatin segregation and condensation protein Rec8/ScpA/Scc1 (kleisin family)